MDNEVVRGTCWVLKQAEGTNGTKAKEEIRTIRRPGGWEFDVAVPTEGTNGTKANGVVRTKRWQGWEFEIVVSSSGPDWQGQTGRKPRDGSKSEEQALRWAKPARVAADAAPRTGVWWSAGTRG